MKGAVLYSDEGESSLIHVTVPESGIAEDLPLGAPVSLLSRQRRGDAADAAARAVLPPDQRWTLGQDGT
nr:hypothetical protein [Streptomyces oryzae]